MRLNTTAQSRLGKFGGAMQKRYFRPLNAVFRAPNTKKRPDERALPLYARKRLSQQDLRSERIQHFAL